MHILGLVLCLLCYCASLGVHMEIPGAAWWAAENRASLWQVEQNSQLQVLKLNSLSILPEPAKLVTWKLQIYGTGNEHLWDITPFRTRQWNTASLMNHPVFLKGWDLLEIKSNRVTQVPTCTTDQSLFGREHLEHIRTWHALLCV